MIHPIGLLAREQAIEWNVAAASDRSPPVAAQQVSRKINHFHVADLAASYRVEGARRQNAFRE
jgi:hypothetical protein